MTMPTRTSSWRPMGRQRRIRTHCMPAGLSNSRSRQSSECHKNANQEEGNKGMIRIDAMSRSLLRATRLLGMVALLLTLFGISSALAQAPAAAPPAATPAAPTDPKPDPNGTATGAATDTFGMPTAQKVNDAVDMTSGDAAAQAKILDNAKKTEPFAAGLADDVGHLKVATNFGWTLNTGYLVLFMQAGFALLTTGLIRKKNAGHLMMLNFSAYVFAFLAYYAFGYAFQFGAVAVNAAPLI